MRPKEALVWVIVRDSRSSEKLPAEPLRTGDRDVVATRGQLLLELLRAAAAALARDQPAFLVEQPQVNLG